jgi:hypothetical protein
MRKEMILVRIAAVSTFLGTAAVVAAGVGYFAHESIGVPPAILRENAVISAVLLSGILLVGLFANISDNKK